MSLLSPFPQDLPDVPIHRFGNIHVRDVAGALTGLVETPSSDPLNRPVMFPSAMSAVFAVRHLNEIS
jgi:hypothetical protein